MVSSTQQTEFIRARNAHKRAKHNKVCVKRRPTPRFPIQPEGYDTSAADAKPTSNDTNA